MGEAEKATWSVWKGWERNGAEGGGRWQHGRTARESRREAVATVDDGPGYPSDGRGLQIMVEGRSRLPLAQSLGLV